MRKIYFKISVVVAGLMGATSVSAIMFDLPADAVSSTVAYIGNLFTDLSPFIFLAIGLPLGFWVIRKTVSLVAGRGR